MFLSFVSSRNFWLISLQWFPSPPSKNKLLLCPNPVGTSWKFASDFFCMVYVSSFLHLWNSGYFLFIEFWFLTYQLNETIGTPIMFWKLHSVSHLKGCLLSFLNTMSHIFYLALSFLKQQSISDIYLFYDGQKLPVGIW